MGTKQTVERTMVGVKKLKLEQGHLFSTLLLNSTEEGVGSPSPSALKAEIEKLGLIIQVSPKSGVNVKVGVCVPETPEHRKELDDLAILHEAAGRSGDADTCRKPDHTVIAAAQAPSENEALLLAICMGARLEISEAETRA